MWPFAVFSPFLPIFNAPAKTDRSWTEKGIKYPTTRHFVSLVRNPGPLTLELWRLRVSEDTNNHRNDCGPINPQSGSSGLLPARRPLRTSPCQLSRQAAQAFQTPRQGRGLTTQELSDLHDTHLETKSGPIIADRRLAPVDQATVLSTNSCFGFALRFSRDERPAGSLPACAWGKS
jgi:hypothetical protein